MIDLTKPRKSYRLVPEGDALRIMGHATRKCLGQSFSLVSWNMYKARKSGWLEDLNALAAQADFILLQEAVLHGDKPHAFHLASGFEWIMGQNFSYHAKDITSGVKTGSRIASLTSRMIRSRDREPFINLPKTILATEYDISNSAGHLLLLNIHAINIVSSRKFSRQIDQLAALMDKHQGPVVLAGDFNTWNPRRRSILARAVAQHSLVRAPVAAPQWRHFNQVLDHVFYRGLKLKSAAALLSIRSSDHIPLRVEFERE